MSTTFSWISLSSSGCDGLRAMVLGLLKSGADSDRQTVPRAADTPVAPREGHPLRHVHFSRITWHYSRMPEMPLLSRSTGLPGWLVRVGLAYGVVGLSVLPILVLGALVTWWMQSWQCAEQEWGCLEEGITMWAGLAVLAAVLHVVVSMRVGLGVVHGVVVVVVAAVSANVAPALGAWLLLAAGPAIAAILTASGPSRRQRLVLVGFGVMLLVGMVLVR
ncbi:hypothetical protein GCM10017772_03200 [Promicromonospora soli]|uniref:Uncharacterized protein n=2 Tax=Promicromonospora soli TaxID=2035533 RepID=A0A919FHK3_9MICO|nr:hypothetical protein GCM10017772_03200 [Promicromonospora soli]